MRTDLQTTDTLDSLPEFCSPGDLSKVLPVSRATLYRMADQGRIPCIRLGRRIIISREHLKRWFDQQMGVYGIAGENTVLHRSLEALLD